MCCPLVFEFSVGIGGFVIGRGQISFFSLYFERIKIAAIMAFWSVLLMHWKQRFGRHDDYIIAIYSVLL